MKRILVTGGAGFIGSHLVERLLKDENNQVIVLDDFSMGKFDNLPTHKRLIVTGASILEDTSYLYEGVDVVFHLAALTRPQDSVLDPERTNIVNVDGTLKVLINSRDAKVKRLVFASSAAVYGNTSHLPTSEQDETYPIDPYGVTKFIGEKYCLLFDQIYGLETNCLRFFNTYGTRQSSNGQYASVVPSFIKKVVFAESPTIYGDGEQSRDFVYVEDVVDALILASNSEVHGEVFNIGSGKDISVNKLFAVIRNKLTVVAEPTYAEPLIEQKKTLANISKAQNLLSWFPKTSIEDGIAMTIEGTVR